MKLIKFAVAYIADKPWYGDSRFTCHNIYGYSHRPFTRLSFYLKKGDEFRSNLIRAYRSSVFIRKKK